MIFKIVKTEHADGLVDHGVALYYDDLSDKQDAVIVHGATYTDAFNLYSDLNEALSNAGLVHTKHKAANDSGGNGDRLSVRVSELIQRVNLLSSENLAAKRDVIKWRQLALASGAILLINWFSHYILHSPF